MELLLNGVIPVEDFLYFFELGAKEATAEVRWDANTGILLSLESDFRLRDHRIQGSPVAFELEVSIDTEVRPTSEMDSLSFSLPENIPEPIDMDPLAQMVLQLAGMELDQEYGDESGDF